MTAPRDPDLLIRAFLEEGRSELPDRTYDAVRDQIDHTRQRVVIGPWREPSMSNTTRLAIAAAAVVVVAVIGIQLLPGFGGGVGGPGPTRDADAHHRPDGRHPRHAIAEPPTPSDVAPLTANDLVPPGPLTAKAARRCWRLAGMGRGAVRRPLQHPGTNGMGASDAGGGRGHPFRTSPLGRSASTSRPTSVADPCTRRRRWIRPSPAPWTASSPRLARWTASRPSR